MTSNDSKIRKMMLCFNENKSFWHKNACNLYFVLMKKWLDLSYTESLVLKRYLSDVVIANKMKRKMSKPVKQNTSMPELWKISTSLLTLYFFITKEVCYKVGFLTYPLRLYFI